MKDARFDRIKTGDASGDAKPTELAPNQLETPEVVPPVRDWTRTARERSSTSMLVHWFDEKGAVVRLITSKDPSIDARDA